MHIPGHLAIAVSEDQLFNLSQGEPLPMFMLGVASLFPDVLDKTMAYGLRWTLSGRHYAHNLVSLTLTSLFVTLIVGKKAGYAWFMGYLGHLVADNDKFVPWFFPFKAYQFPKGRGLHLDKTPVLKEVGFLLVTLIYYYFSSRPQTES